MKTEIGAAMKSQAIGETTFEIISYSPFKTTKELTCKEEYHINVKVYFHTHLSEECGPYKISNPDKIELKIAVRQQLPLEEWVVVYHPYNVNPYHPDPYQCSRRLRQSEAFETLKETPWEGGILLEPSRAKLAAHILAVEVPEILSKSKDILSEYNTEDMRLGYDMLVNFEEFTRFLRDIRLKNLLTSYELGESIAEGHAKIIKEIREWLGDNE